MNTMFGGFAGVAEVVGAADVDGFVADDEPLLHDATTRATAGKSHATA
jgi:hypothetical protein